MTYNVIHSVLMLSKHCLYLSIESEVKTSKSKKIQINILRESV